MSKKYEKTIEKAVGRGLSRALEKVAPAAVVPKPPSRSELAEQNAAMRAELDALKTQVAAPPAPPAKTAAAAPHAPPASNRGHVPMINNSGAVDIFSLTPAQCEAMGPAGMRAEYEKILAFAKEQQGVPRRPTMPGDIRGEVEAAFDRRGGRY